MSQRLLDGLNPPQRRAVITTEGPLLVLAGAGTGKTRVVTVRIGWLLANGVASENVLAVTFTNKAAREMKERVTSIVGKKAAKGLTISTFHSFALSVLREHADRIGLRKSFTIADEEDRLSMLRSALRESGISESQVSPKWGTFRISDWKNAAIGPDEAMEVACDEAEIFLAHAYKKVQEEMHTRSVVDFDDMILYVVRLLDSCPDVLDQCRDRYRYLMVDEYQDTNTSQYRVVRQLAGARRNLCVVGDDDQSIYGWRGARAGAILEFTRDWPGAEVVTLDQNYRSTTAILNAANAVITHNLGRREKALWSDLGAGEPLSFYKADDERDEMLWLVERIQRLRDRGAKWEDLAVLFRANTQSGPLEVAFRERDIPYRVVGTRSLFDRREIRDLLAYLRVLQNSQDDGALGRVINTPSRGIGKGTREKLVAAAVRRRVGTFQLIEESLHEIPELAGRARDSVAAFRDMMLEVRRRGESGAHAAISHLIEAINYQAWLDMDSPDGMTAQIRKNVVDMLLDVAARHDEDSPGKGIGGFLESLQLRERDSKDDTDEVGLTLLTVHASKGLEYPHVFLVGLEDGVFPHKKSIGDEDNIDAVDEERRLFYVAVTRARRSLQMSMAVHRTRFGRVEIREPSRFIAEIGEDNLEVIDASAPGESSEESTASYLDALKKQLGA